MTAGQWAPCVYAQSLFKDLGCCQVFMLDISRRQVVPLDTSYIAAQSKTPEALVWRPVAFGGRSGVYVGIPLGVSASQYSTPPG